MSKRAMDVDGTKSDRAEAVVSIVDRRDGATVVGHLGATATLGAVSFVASGPLATLIGISLSALLYGVLLYNENEGDQRFMRRYREDEWKALGISEETDAMCARLGLDQKIRLCRENERPGRAAKASLGVAASSYCQRPKIFMEHRAFGKVAPDELCAAFAHEAAHIGARSTKTYLLSLWSASAIELAAGAGVLGNILGWRPGASVSALFVGAAGYGVTRFLGNKIKQSWGLQDEYWADRGAVRLGVDPLALVRMLRRMSPHSEWPVEGDAERTRKPSAVGWIKEVWEDGANGHPRIRNRIERLAQQAAQLGHTKAEIETSVFGPLVRGVCTKQSTTPAVSFGPSEPMPNVFRTNPARKIAVGR